MDAERRILGGPPTIDLGDVSKHHIKFNTESNTTKFQRKQIKSTYEEKELNTYGFSNK